MTSKTSLTILLIITIWIVNSHQFCYMFNYGNTNNGPYVVTHSAGYTGKGGEIEIKVGINPSSTNLAAFRTPVLNTILTWNLQIPTIKNTKPVPDTSKYDIESVCLHEMGHALGIAHTNLASESGLGSPSDDGTSAYKNSDGKYNVNAGSDGIYGSYDDIRGDDLNLYYFNPTNNPFVLVTPTDKTTYKTNLSSLPSGHKFATSGGLETSVGLVNKRSFDDEFFLYEINNLSPVISYTAEENILTASDDYLTHRTLKNRMENGVEFFEEFDACGEVLKVHPEKSKRARRGTTEAVMQQGSYKGEAQRTLAADDVAALAYAQTGVDEIAGTSDDYRFKMVYVGDSTGNDIDVYNDPSYTGVGTCSVGSTKISGFHYRITSSKVRINPSLAWYYNPLLVSYLIFPSSQSASISSNQVMTIDLYFASKGPSSLSTSHFTYSSSIGGSLSINKIDNAHYSIQISGFSGAGSPCLQLSANSLTDTQFGTKYEPSNQLCFSVSGSSSSNPSPSSAPSPSSSKPPAQSSSPSSSKLPSSPSSSKSPAAPSSAPSSNPSPSSSKSPAAPAQSPAPSSSKLPSSPSSSKSPAAAPSSNPSPSSSKSPAAPAPAQSPSATSSSAPPPPSAGSPSPIIRTGTSLINVAKIRCQSGISRSQCCKNFEVEWPTLSNLNSPVLVKVHGCEGSNDGSTFVIYVQNGSQYYSSSSILLDYFRLGSCKQSLNSICYPSSGSLVSSSWSSVSYIQKRADYNYNNEILDEDFDGVLDEDLPGENYYYYVFDDPFADKKRDQLEMNAFVEVNSASSFALSLLLLPLFAFFF